MHYFAHGLLALLLLTSSFLHAQDTQDDLDRYVERLRRSSASGGNETAFLSPGADFLYGQDYFEAKNYSSAVWYFQDVLKKDKDNAFAHYQLAIALMRQNDKYKTQQAQDHLREAFRLQPSLKERYGRDVPAAKAAGLPPAAMEAAAKTQGLEAYIEGLKYSRATGGKETVMFSAGQEVMYGYDYYEKGEYASAETRFRLALAIDPENPYIHYLLAVSQAAQGEKSEAQTHYNKAITGDAGLKNSYAKEVAAAAARHKAYEDSKKVTTTPAAKPVYGGALVYGKYTCHQSVWNGPNISPAYSYKYHGYFELKKDGTYRWLDDGATGRYTYDARTGTVRFTSGHLATARSSRYQSSKTVPQITVTFTDNYRWECGCKK
ncbi:MAG TPA: tetratricopeptide repeat protein [Chitinophagaceae bacterium]